MQISSPENIWNFVLDKQNLCEDRGICLMRGEYTEVKVPKLFIMKLK